MKDALLRGKDAHIEDLKLAGSINMRFRLRCRPKAEESEKVKKKRWWRRRKEEG